MDINHLYLYHIHVEKGTCLYSTKLYSYLVTYTVKIG